LDFVLENLKMCFLLYIIAMSNRGGRRGLADVQVASGDIWGLGLKTWKKCT
jgi:hypothetical protein